MLVEEVMTRNVVTIDCNKTIYEACEVYKKEKVGCLVVMDKDMIVGIVTERDMIERAILGEKNPKKVKVKQIMSTNIRTVHALAPLEKASQIMKENNIKKLPVILNNDIVGIITVTDLSHTIDAFSESIDDLAKFYASSKNSIEKILDDWGDLLINLREHRRLIETKQIDACKEETKTI